MKNVSLARRGVAFEFHVEVPGRASKVHVPVAESWHLKRFMFGNALTVCFQCPKPG